MQQGANRPGFVNQGARLCWRFAHKRKKTYKGTAKGRPFPTESCPATHKVRTVHVFIHKTRTLRAPCGERMGRIVTAIAPMGDASDNQVALGLGHTCLRGSAKQESSVAGSAEEVRPRLPVRARLLQRAAPGRWGGRWRCRARVGALRPTRNGTHAGLSVSRGHGTQLVL